MAATSKKRELDSLDLAIMSCKFRYRRVYRLVVVKGKLGWAVLDVWEDLSDEKE